MKRLLVIGLSILLMLASGCSSVSAEQSDGLRFYYCVSSEVHTGSAISYELLQPEEYTVEATLRRLFSGPEQVDLTKTFPSGTHLLGWSLENSVLRINLSEEFGGLSGIALIKAEYCLVMTLCQLDGVESVSIMVDGRLLPGSGSTPLSEHDVVLKGEIQDPVTVSLQLYFPLADLSGLGLEYRVFEVADSSVRAQANGVLEQLISGPTEDEMTAFLNNSGKISVASVQDAVCVVELDGASLSAICADSETFPLFLYSIVNSLIEVDGIDAVSFVVEEIAVPGFEDSYQAAFEF